MGGWRGGWEGRWVGSKGKGREEPTLTTTLSGKATSIEPYTRNLKIFSQTNTSVHITRRKTGCGMLRERERWTLLGTFQVR